MYETDNIAVDIHDRNDLPFSAIASFEFQWLFPDDKTCAAFGGKSPLGRRLHLSPLHRKPENRPALQRGQKSWPAVITDRQIGINGQGRSWNAVTYL